MTTTPTPVERQAPTALLALVQHIHDHQLGMPLTIHAPATAAPYFSLAVMSASLPAWVASGLAVTTEIAEPRTNTVNGHRWERVQIDGLLQPYGIRVQLVAHRTVAAPPALHAVSA